MARIGYARVSSVGQSLEVQLEKLTSCDKTYQEKKSGSVGKRSSLEACLEYVRDGDTLVITRLDRLARSTLHLCQIAAELQRKGVDLQVLDQQIDTTTSTGRLLFHMLGAIAQFETEIRAERQRDGIEHAKARGVPLGRRKALSRQRITELQARRQQGTSIGTLMHDYRISKATVYRYLSEAGPEIPAPLPLPPRADVPAREASW
jgi:DNA invertase Pin-like site-specific DNA recombinase